MEEGERRECGGAGGFQVQQYTPLINGISELICYTKISS